MRVRHLAVVGAALVAAWAGGTGIAQATGGEDGSACAEQYLATTTGEGTTDPDDCEWPLPDDCEYLAALTSEGGAAVVDAVHPDHDCDPEPVVTVTVGVQGDCKDPETFTVTVNATGLEPTTDYVVALTTADLLTTEPPEGSYVLLDVTSNADGAVVASEQSVTEGRFDFPAGAFDLHWVVLGEHEAFVPVLGRTHVGECTPVTEPVVVPPAAQPAAPAAPVAAPVVVTPVAAHPAVLANTGTPVTAAALLGGGLLVAGAGALVAARRRAS